MGRRQRDLADKDRALDLISPVERGHARAADLVTVVGDRESDIYELLPRPGPRTHLLVRAQIAALPVRVCWRTPTASAGSTATPRGAEARQQAHGEGRVASAVCKSRPARMPRGLPDAVAMTRWCARSICPKVKPGAGCC
jgi:hypothetical protein